MGSKIDFLSRNRMFYGIGLLVFLGAFSVLFGQAPGGAADGGVQRISLQDYNPKSERDSRIVVSNFNMDRRYASNGRGEFLDVIFDVYNQTSEAIDIYGFVLAFYETDAVLKEAREVIPYPSWRINDPDSSRFLVHFITITPLDIQPDEVWKVLDPEIKVSFESIIARMRNRPVSLGPIDHVRPPFWGYLTYISQKPTQGLRFKLYGEAGPGSKAEGLQTNYIPPTPEEKKSWMHKTLPQHKYTLEHSRRHTVFRSHHYSPFRANYKFFNMVSVLLFDAAKAEALEEQNKNPQPGQERINPLVYKQNYRIAREMKVY